MLNRLMRINSVLSDQYQAPGNMCFAGHVGIGCTSVAKLASKVFTLLPRHVRGRCRWQPQVRLVLLCCEHLSRVLVGVKVRIAAISLA